VEWFVGAIWRYLRRDWKEGNENEKKEVKKE
jgi:hypothetical protein